MVGRGDREDQNELTQQPEKEKILYQLDGLALVTISDIDDGQQKRAQQAGKGCNVDLHKERW